MVGDKICSRYNNRVCVCVCVRGDAQMWKPRTAVWASWCAHRHDVLKGGRRLGLLVAQELEGFGLGAGGASGLRGRHLLRRRLVVCCVSFADVCACNETVYQRCERLVVMLRRCNRLRRF